MRSTAEFALLLNEGIPGADSGHTNVCDCKTHAGLAQNQASIIGFSIPQGAERDVADHSYINVSDILLSGVAIKLFDRINQSIC